MRRRSRLLLLLAGLPLYTALLMFVATLTVSALIDPTEIGNVMRELFDRELGEYPLWWSWCGGPAGAESPFRWSWRPSCRPFPLGFRWSEGGERPRFGNPPPVSGDITRFTGP